MFKMKGPSMHKGTAGHKKAVQTFHEDRKRYQDLAMKRDMEKNMPDGRSTSSPFQAKTDSDKQKDDGYKYGKEKLVSETTTKNKRGGVDTERKYETKGTKYTPPKKTSEGDAKYAAMSKAERKAADDKYRAANTKTRTKTRSERESTKGKLDPIKIKPKPVKLDTEVKMEPVKAKKLRKPRKKDNIFERTGEKIGDAVKSVGDNIRTRRHMRKNRVGRRRRGRRTIGCGPR